MVSKTYLASGKNSLSGQLATWWMLRSYSINGKQDPWHHRPFGVTVGAGRKQHTLACQLWIHWNTSCGCCTSHRLCTWRWQVKDWLMFNQTASDICVLTLTPHQVMSGKVQGFAACVKKLPADTCVTTRYTHTPACYPTHQHTPSSPIQAWQIKSNLKLLAQWKYASPPCMKPTPHIYPELTVQPINSSANTHLY